MLYELADDVLAPLYLHTLYLRARYTSSVLQHLLIFSRLDRARSSLNSDTTYFCRLRFHASVPARHDLASPSRPRRLAHAPPQAARPNYLP